MTRQPRAKWGAVLRPVLRVDLLANAKAIDDPVTARTATALKVRDRAGWRAVGRLSQFYWRIRRRYALLTVTTSDPADPLAAWCGPERLRVEGGLRIARRQAAWSG